MGNIKGFKNALLTSLLAVSLVSLSGCVGPLAAIGIAGMEQNRAKGCEVKERELRANKKNKESDVKWGMINGGCRDYYMTATRE